MALCCLLKNTVVVIACDVVNVHLPGHQKQRKLFPVAECTDFVGNVISPDIFSYIDNQPARLVRDHRLDKTVQPSRIAHTADACRDEQLAAGLDIFENAVAACAVRQ